MKRYTVELCFTAFAQYEVEAESEDMARAAAEGMYDGGVAPNWDGHERWPEADMVEEVLETGMTGL
jgi:hypothetical protein